jgi:hypothetical protein
MLIYSTVALKGVDRSRMLVALILTIFSSCSGPCSSRRVRA